MRRVTRIFIAAVFLAASLNAFPPHRIVANIYFVGQDDLASYLIVTPKGNILINTGFEFSVPVIRAGAKSLGFRFEDIRILLVTHAHSDHAAGLATVKRLTGAKMLAIEEEAPLLESGGKTDFLFGSAGWFAPAKVDRTFKDGGTIELGGTALTAHLTPGHTKGSTSYSLDVSENGRTYHVLIANLPAINEGADLLHNPKYPNMAEDYARAFRVLKDLPCDIFLSSHTGQYRLGAKYRPGMAYSPDTFLDPEGYRDAVARLEVRYLDELKQQRDEERFTRDHLNFRDIKESPPQ